MGGARWIGICAIGDGLGMVSYPLRQYITDGRKLCELLLEPSQDAFGRIEIRSAYRSSAVNEFGNKKKRVFRKSCG